MSRGAAAALLGAALTATACLHRSYATAPRVAVVDGDPVVQMAAPGKFPSLENPRSVPFRQHGDPPFRKEKVVGLALGPAPQMYPIGLLDTYEVVNDEAGGVPFVVARCALSDLTAVYDRRVAGRVLTFENSGALWRDTLVLKDRETGTWWTPASGRALFGPLAGERLTGIPGAVTTAEAWEELHPKTVCPETGDLTAVPLRLRAYAASSWQGISGVKATDLRYKPKDTVFFIAGEGEVLAFPAAEIRERRTLETTLGGSVVTVEWDAALRAPRGYRQVVAARHEIPVLPMYWFAVLRHFPKGVRSAFVPAGNASGRPGRSSDPTRPGPPS